MFNARPTSLVAFPLLAITAALAGCASHPTRAHGPSARDTIVVVGHGKVHVKPDAARVQLGVDVAAPTVTEATRLSAERMTALIAALKEAGIAENDVQTSNYSIHLDRTERPIPMPMPAPMPKDAKDTGGRRPATPPPPPPEAQQGVYRVTNTVEVIVRDPSRVGPVIDRATAAGANNVWGITFILENTTAAEADARAKAVADARQRADALARLASVKLGPIVSVSEIVGMGQPMLAGARAATAFDKATPVESGTLAYTDEVQVVFAIER